MDAPWRALKPTDKKNFIISRWFSCARFCEKIFGDGEAKGSGHVI